MSHLPKIYWEQYNGLNRIISVGNIDLNNGVHRDEIRVCNKLVLFMVPTRIVSLVIWGA